MAALRVTTLPFVLVSSKTMTILLRILWLVSRPTTKYMYMENILPRRMSASHFGQEMAQNADLPIRCKNFSGATPPNPRPVLGHRAVLFPDSRCFGSHNFQIVPARLTEMAKTCDLKTLRAQSWKQLERCYLATIANYYIGIRYVRHTVGYLGDSLASCFILNSCR